jgi:phosphoribosylformimino-5-aminoimidazole carboxamide ribotide isomerase
MDIIPVLDIREGLVVHARHGQRASYAPLRSGLVRGCEPRAVLTALLDAAGQASGRPAPAAYIADLDGIAQSAPQWPVLEALRNASPVPLWLDAGLEGAANIVETARRGFVPVVGSESLRDVDLLHELRATLGAGDWLLSLDADANGARDPIGAVRHPACWPQRVIAMDLTRVGSEAGPVGMWLRDCMALSREKDWIAAGGVRDRRDLSRLRDAGLAGVLVATSLHNGSLSSPPDA